MPIFAFVGSPDRFIPGGGNSRPPPAPPPSDDWRSWKEISETFASGLVFSLCTLADALILTLFWMLNSPSIWWACAPTGFVASFLAVAAWYFEKEHQPSTPEILFINHLYRMSWNFYRVSIVVLLFIIHLNF